MSKEFTNGIKGLAILMVFVIHIAGQFGVPSVQFIAGAGVSLFLILSGYGIESSYRKTGIRGFWIKKIITVLVPYWIVLVASAVYLKYGADELFTMEEIRDGFLLKSSNWYVPYILGCYLVFWIAALICSKKSNNARLLTVCVLFLVWLVMELVLLDKVKDGPLRIRQMFCFPFGMWLCDNSKKLFEMDNKKKQIFIGIVLAFAGTAITIVSQKLSVIPYATPIVSLCSVFLLGLGLLMIAVLMQKLFEKGFFAFFGIISYELFLVHWQLMDYVYWKFDGIGRFVICTTIGVTLLTLLDRYVLEKVKNKILSCMKK